jgi:hypothetical protein
MTSAIIGPHTMAHLDDLLAGVDVTLTDEVLDRIDEIVPSGTEVGAPDQSAYLPPALQRPAPPARRRASRRLTEPPAPSPGRRPHAPPGKSARTTAHQKGLIE